MNMFHVNLQGCSMESTHLSHVTALTIIIKINTPTPTPDLTFSRTILEWRSKAFTRAKILRLLRQLISTCKAVAPWTPWNHLKMDGWNTFSFPFGFWPIIRCEVLVLGSVLCVSTANGQVQLWVGAWVVYSRRWTAVKAKKDLVIRHVLSIKYSLVIQIISNKTRLMCIPFPNISPVESDNH